MWFLFVLDSFHKVFEAVQYFLIVSNYNCKGKYVFFLLKNILLITLNKCYDSISKIQFSSHFTFKTLLKNPDFPSRNATIIHNK